MSSKKVQRKHHSYHKGKVGAKRFQKHSIRTLVGWPVPSRAGDKFLTLDEEDISHSLSITYLAYSVNNNIPTQSVSRGFPSRCLLVLSFVVYSFSKLRRFKNRKEKTERK